MSTTKHREVARLDRVPLPIEAARIGATGWQITRTGARVVTKLATRGSLQQKIIREIPQTFADLGPTYVKFGQIIASSPGAFGEPLRPGDPQLDPFASLTGCSSPGPLVDVVGDEDATSLAGRARLGEGLEHVPLAAGVQHGGGPGRAGVPR